MERAFMNLARISDVIKASPAIQVQSKMTLLQRRAWNVLLANAYNELLDKDIHTVSMAELSAKLGFGDGNQEYLKEMLRSLRSCEVEWNLLNKDRKQVWGVASPLSVRRDRKRHLYLRLCTHLRRQLYNPRIYAKLNLRLQNQFKSRYALVLWEVCFDYFDTDRDQGETPFISLEVFKELMGLEKDEYPLFKELNRNVIKLAVKEINELTNYHIEVERKRVGRRIGLLKFSITRVEQIPIQESLFPDIENLPVVAIELVQSGVDRNVALKIAKAEWDFITPEQLPSPVPIPIFSHISLRRSKSRSTPQMSKTGPGSLSMPSEATIKTSTSKTHAPNAPRKPNRSNSKNSKKNSTSNATIFSDKPYTHILIWLMPPQKKSGLTSFGNASMSTQHLSKHIRKAVWSRQR